MFWYQGKLSKEKTIVIEITDPGLLYGATVFTTVRIYGQSLEHPLTHWQNHCDRLSQSLESLDWCLPDWQLLRQGAETLLQDYPILRLTIFPDGRVLIIPRFLPENLTQLQQQGIKGRLTNSSIYRRYLPEHKTGNYLGAWLARRKAQEFEANEAILTDAQGNWLETSTGNLWGLKNGRWYTPSLAEGILPGIVQQQLLYWLEKQHIPVRQGKWSSEWVETLQAIAYTNSVVEIIPFDQVDTPTTTIKLDPFVPALAQLRNYFNDFTYYHA